MAADDSDPVIIPLHYADRATRLEQSPIEREEAIAICVAASLPACLALVVTVCAFALGLHPLALCGVPIGVFTAPFGFVYGYRNRRRWFGITALTLNGLWLAASLLALLGYLY